MIIRVDYYIQVFIKILKLNKNENLVNNQFIY